MPRQPDQPRSTRSARTSLRFLFRTPSTSLRAQGLVILRDPARSPDQLDVDEVLERLQIVGVPDTAVSIHILNRGKGKAQLEIHVDTSAVIDVLAPLFPDIAQALVNLKDAQTAQGVTAEPRELAPTPRAPADTPGEQNGI